MSNSVKKGRTALGRGLSSLISTPVVPLKSNRIVSAFPLNPSSPGHNGNLAEDLSRNQEASANEISTSSEARFEGGSTLLDRSLIVPNSAQPRKTFVDAEIKELAESIKNMGVLQPILVRPGKGANDGKYEIVAGERRWRASEIAKLEQLPVIIKELSDWESLEIALVENVQRADLNVLEEAKAYQRLMDQYSLSQQDVADRIGKERATVANILRILKLPNDVQNFIEKGELTLGHAKALLSVKDPRAQLSLAKKAVEDGLSVRALETIVSQSAPLDGSKQAALMGGGIAPASGRRLVTFFPEIVEKLRRKMGTKVLIKHNKSGKGRIEIEYFSEAELERLIEILS